MEMWPTHSTLVFLTVAVAAMVISGQDPVILDKRQREVEVFSGSPLNLHCNISTEGYERFLVFWYFNSNEPSICGTCNFSKKMYDRAQKNSTVVSNKKKDEEALLHHTSHATKNNSGWYFCKVTVDIPHLEEFNSSGTQVVITKSEEHTTYPVLPVITLVTAKQETPSDDPQFVDRLLWIILGVSAFILIVLLVTCVLVRRRYRRSRAEDPIYANTHRPMAKQPSPRPGMDNLKAVSSTQNLRNLSPGRRYDEGKRRPKQ